MAKLVDPLKEKVRLANLRAPAGVVYRLDLEERVVSKSTYGPRGILAEYEKISFDDFLPGWQTMRFMTSTQASRTFRRRGL
jgi:hypothetical protein